MEAYGLPALTTLLVWWFSTGAILYLDGLPRTTYRWSMLGATAVLAAGLYGLFATRHDTGVSGAYVAFLCTIGVWGWQEVGFLLGFVTGPRREPCPPGCTGWRRAGLALGTILHHELAILALGAAVFALTWGGANPVGPWTFLVLWAMRQSAKLNLFLGVRNLSEEFLPDHLRYLESYFRRRTMNPLFPVSIAGSAIVTLLVWQAALAPDAGAARAAGLAFVGTLLALAILEHVFMLLPIPVSLLWRWSFRSRARAPSPAAVAGEAGLQAWTTPLSRPCDPRGVQQILEAVARGSYGEVDRVRGIARAHSGWIRFEMDGGRARVAHFAPNGHDIASVTAFGRRLDEIRLQAAFDACAQPAT
jgi:putative photosynthetic complex assembly protein 2